MGFDRIRIKENAKRHYENNKWQNVLVVLITMLIGSGIGAVANFIPILGPIVTIAASLFVVSVISMGSATWFHRAIKTDGLKMEEMFWTFKEDYVGNIGLVLLIGVYTFLWTLLFYIPGIVKSYSYSLALYIKSENPSIKAEQAIDLSKRMTNGHKMDLFVLDLSFIGWFILSGITFNILGVIYVIPYYNAAKAFAYEEIKEDALAKQIVTESELYGYMN